MPTTGGADAPLHVAAPLVHPAALRQGRPKRGQVSPFPNGDRSYFPTRVPKDSQFDLDPAVRFLYSEEVVDIINGLCLPRYGLGTTRGRSGAPRDDRGGPRPSGTWGAREAASWGLPHQPLQRLESSGAAFLLPSSGTSSVTTCPHAIRAGKPSPGDAGRRTAGHGRARREERGRWKRRARRHRRTPTGEDAALHTEADFRRRAAACTRSNRRPTRTASAGCRRAFSRSACTTTLLSDPRAPARPGAVRNVAGGQGREAPAPARLLAAERPHDRF